MPIAFFDTECYRNYWLLKIRPQGSSQVISFSLQAGERFDSPTAGRIAQIFGQYTVISFNGINYDVPMISAALAGYKCEELKARSDLIIPDKDEDGEQVKGAKPWELPDATWKPADHIDITETLPGKGSQKVYAGRIHYKTMRDLPLEPHRILTPAEMVTLDEYCENDLGQLEAEYTAALDLIKMREEVGSRYGLDLRSKSDAQCAEAILKHRCEQALGCRIYKADVDWNLAFRYEPPAWLTFQSPEMLQAFDLAKAAIFRLGPTGAVVMPETLEGLKIPLGTSVYRMGIGGLHSSEKRCVQRSDAEYVIRDVDVASYYPSLILNSGKYPLALGPAFLSEFGGLKAERLGDKKEQRRLEEAGLTGIPEWFAAYCRNEGKKVFINGTFGKTGNFYSILFAPQMMIQTTLTGQLALLMLAEWHELNGISVVSANTDGLVIRCPRARVADSDYLVKEWERRTNLEMEAGEYLAVYSRDINNYFAIKPGGEVKRKGAYAKASLVGKKSPDVEICSDAVADFLAHGTPIIYTIAACRDIRKFVTVQKVAGGAVKLWGEGPRKGCLVRDMEPVLRANGWVKSSRRWTRQYPITIPMSAAEAYKLCFPHPQIPEYLGKVIRWYYSPAAPGPIIYNTNGNTVGLSYGAKPCMTLPDEFPDDIDYAWYWETAKGILRDIGYVQTTN